MKRVINSLIGISMILSSCDYVNFTKGVKNDSEKIFVSHKKFFKSLFFNGTISEKKYCAKCQFNKYQIIIDLKEKEPKTIDIGNFSYQPYYFFNDKNQLTISVTPNLYESVKAGLFIEKKMDSDSLTSERLQYDLLSDKESQWVPK